MNNKAQLLTNLDKIHLTKLGIVRVNKNLKLTNNDIIKYLKDKILKTSSKVYKKGKNFYCEIDNIKITINSFSYTIITAHQIKNKKENLNEFI